MAQFHQWVVCSKEVLEEIQMSFISTQDTEIRNIDIYDTPIDLRPLPSHGTVAYCIDYLRDHGDHYGVQLLEQMRDEENVENLECPREEASSGTL